MFHKHTHNWKIVSSQKYNHLSCWDQTQIVDRTTKILTKCSDCGLIKIQEIDGHWTTEELKGES